MRENKMRKKDKMMTRRSCDLCACCPWLNGVVLADKLGAFDVIWLLEVC